MKRRQMLALTTAVLCAPALVQASSSPIKVRNLYARDGSMSELAVASDGKRLSVEGFMAPPLQANSTFFVQTKMPMSVCPFCETEAEWPDDIVAVYTARIYDVAPFNRKIVTTGILELGSYRDPDTGFLSMVRIARASYRYA